MPHTDLPQSDLQPLARLAYAAYGHHTGHLTHDGRPMPAWDDLGENIQDAWSAAATAVANTVADAQASLPTALAAPGPAAPQRPSIGRIVLVPMDPVANNGATQAPAVITRVWSDATINVRVLGDSTLPAEWRTSVTYVPDLAQVDRDDPVRLHRWSWPPRI